MEKKRAIVLFLTIFFAVFLSGFEEKKGAEAISVEEHPEEPVQESLDNYSNKSMYTEVHPGDSIQKAIDNVSSGGTVIVYPGLYKENLIVEKPLVIMSKEGTPANTVIQTADPEKDIFDVTADNVTIGGFNITGTERAGILCSGSNDNITRNELRYNEYGIYLNDSSRNILENNEVNNNSFGICLSNSNNNWLKNNSISGVGLFVGLNNDACGIYLEDSNNNKLIGNEVLKLWEGVNLTESSSNELNNNSILENYFSLSLVNSNNNKVLNNTIVKLGYSYSVIIAHSHNNILQGNTVGLNNEIKVTYGLNSTNNTLEGEIDNADEPRTPAVNAGDFWT